MLSPALFGWSLILSTVVAFTLAFLFDRPALAHAGAGLAGTACAFLAQAPVLRLPACIAFASTCAAALVFARGRKDIPFALLLPFAMLVTVVGVFALRGIHFSGAF